MLPGNAGLPPCPGPLLFDRISASFQADAVGSVIFVFQFHILSGHGRCLLFGLILFTLFHEAANCTGAPFFPPDSMSIISKFWKERGGSVFSLSRQPTDSVFSWPIDLGQVLQEYPAHLLDDQRVLLAGMC